MLVWCSRAALRISPRNRSRTPCRFIRWLLTTLRTSCRPMSRLGPDKRSPCPPDRARGQPRSRDDRPVLEATNWPAAAPPNSAFVQQRQPGERRNDRSRTNRAGLARHAAYRESCRTTFRQPGAGSPHASRCLLTDSAESSSSLPRPYDCNIWSVGWTAAVAP